MKKIWENEFNFCIIHIKIRLCDSFHENLRKKCLTHLLKTILTNRGKNEDEDKKNLKSEFNFSILHIKIRLYRNFHKNLKRNF